jgi:glutamyl-tRNA synthetase
MELDNIIRKNALKNAIDFKGKANPGAIAGKILGTHAEWREKRAELMKKVDVIVSEVNRLTPEQQKGELEKLAPEMLVKEEKKEKNIFEFLRIKEGDRIVTAFPPGPEKYLHIGHAKAALMNFLLAERYGGDFLLRFEDTNPHLVKSIFYDIIPEDLAWLGIKWKRLIYASDHMPLFYSLCKRAMKEENAYVCTCSEEKISETREKGVPCDCRDRSPEENIEMWKNMPNVPEGHAIVRLKIDLKHQNTTMRDPTIFRIIDEPHARHGKKYRVWPNYDWQNAIIDSETGVTHRIRSKEFELRNELQRYIQNMLGIRQTFTYELGRFELEGVETSGRKIREGIEQGRYVGWDDPSLATLRALKRRGFLPEAIKNFVVSTGLSKAEATLTWDDIILHNRRLLDASADRYSFVKDPVELWVKGAPKQNVEMNLHPEHRRGGRKFDTYDLFYITKDDAAKLEEGKLYRLMDCLNFRKQKDGFEFDSKDVERYKQHGEKIIHWLPQSDDLIDVEIMMPDKTLTTGLGERTMLKIKVGDVVQFERYGFCRIDKKEKSDDGKEKLVFWYTHK